MPSIFIGHGRSPQWRDLQQFLSGELGLPCDDFEAVSVAGITITDRLDVMAEEACFAFLVMTAEVEHVDGTRHARENVIHEVGLFQSRLGSRKAIILLEEGCAEPSNFHGLLQIRFPSGDILARSEQIRAVLIREGILNSETGYGISPTAFPPASVSDSKLQIISFEEVDWKIRDGIITSGPYCPRCGDADGREIRLRDDFVDGIGDMTDVKYGGHVWSCPVCNTSYDRDPSLRLRPGMKLPAD